MILGGVVMMGLFLGCATATPAQQASSATAQDPQAEKTAVADAKDAKQDPDRTLICESIKVTGSHIPRKVCRTARQVQEEREAAEKAIRDADKINREFNQ
jgi:hypothetical protein